MVAEPRYHSGPRTPPAWGAFTLVWVWALSALSVAGCVAAVCHALLPPMLLFLAYFAASLPVIMTVDRLVGERLWVRCWKEDMPGPAVAMHVVWPIVVPAYVMAALCGGEFENGWG